MQHVGDDRYDRSRIDDAHDSGCRCRFHRGLHRVCGDLRAHQNATCGGECRAEAPLDLLRRDRRVGSAADGDLILAVLVDDDQGDARGFTFQHSDVAGVDPLGCKLGNRCRTGVVRADSADHSHTRSYTCRGNRRVGTLASAVRLQSPADDRLTRTGQPGRHDDEIDVDRANNNDRPPLVTLPYHTPEATQAGRCEPPSVGDSGDLDGHGQLLARGRAEHDAPRTGATSL